MSISNFYQDKEHFINTMNVFHKNKFDVPLSQRGRNIFRLIYETLHFKNLFQAFDLTSLVDRVSWEFRNLKSSKKDLEKFFTHKIKLLLEVTLFIEDSNNVSKNLCDDLIEYCHYDTRLKKISDFLELIKETDLLEYKDICENALEELKKLIDIHGVYFIYNKSRKLIYIGKSYDLSLRIPQSARERGGSLFSYMETKTKVDADMLEPYMINKLKPILNSTFMTKERSTFKIKEPNISELIVLRKEEGIGED